MEHAKVPFAIAGGYALALHGAVRGTVDVDIVLQLNRGHFLAAEAALKGIGLLPRLPISAAEVFDFREEYIKNRNLIAWSFSNPADPSMIVDVIITHDLSKLKVTSIRSGNRKLPVLSVRDLIAMKKASARPQDLEDVRVLEAMRR